MLTSGGRAGTVAKLNLSGSPVNSPGASPPSSPQTAAASFGSPPPFMLAGGAAAEIVQL